MKKILLLFIIPFLALQYAGAQNCGVTSVGLPPLNDLGTGYWRGAQGGLYPNGSNNRPSAHNAAGINIASQMLPLDTNGNVDMVNGKIVWLSVGMSNTTQESSVFIPLADSFSLKNPKCVLVDGAQGGQDIGIIDDPSATYWSISDQRLRSAGLSPKQVQVIWFKEAEKNPIDTAFATYPDSLKLAFKTGLQIVKTKYPNTKLAYLASRIYAGYASSTLNPEPYSWYSGWSVKRLIEDQINGDTSLSYTGANARVPWLAWGPYLWADGTTQRSDGLVWNCPTDYISDGTHPSATGRAKVAQMLFNFFSTDSTTTPWFIDQTLASVSTAPSAQPFSFFPNPTSGQITISGLISGQENQLKIVDLLGNIVFEKNNVSSSETIDCSAFANGMYFVQLSSVSGLSASKLIIER